MIERTDAATLNRFVNETVSDRVSLISTDDHQGYRFLSKMLSQGLVPHSEGEHVCGAIHTNIIEGFWSIVKRGIVGTSHKVSKKYLHLCVNEFEFRHNQRLNADIFGGAIKAC
ncbi:MAG: transposase [Nitrospirae bacterium]|nr:transposase [Nitrospirota bacterium]MDE3039879.1 transposase [Nitrospirota bacterium]